MISSKPIPVIDILEARCLVKDDTEVSKWYNEVHLPILSKSNKVQSLARYKVVEPNSKMVRYFVICKYNSQKEFEEFRASQEFKDAGKDKPESLSLKIQSFPPIHCALIREWVK